MKINFELDMEDLISDMLCDESYDIEEAIKGEIISKTIRKILPTIEKQVNEQIFKRVDVVITERIDQAVESAISNIIDNGVITHRGVTMTMEERIIGIFSDHSSWGNPMKKLESIAKKFGEELKLQYNAAFATRIVVNMKEQGLLKDDVVKVLLENK
jgi:hypothetical protein